jgi:hypothetical protein
MAVDVSFACWVCVVRHTVGAIGADQTAHAHCRCAVEEAFGDEAICLGDSGQTASNREHAVVDALDDLADAGAHARLVAQIGDVLARLANDDAGLLRGDNGAEGELRVRVLLLGARGNVGLAVHVQAVELLGDATSILAGSGLGLFGGHGVGMAWERAAGAFSDVSLRRATRYHLRESRGN